VLACLALGIVYAISAMLRPAFAPDGGGNVATFAAPSPGQTLGANGPHTR
jgi:hypothetical protein